MAPKDLGYISGSQSVTPRPVPAPSLETLSEMQILGPHPDFTNSGGGTQISVIDKSFLPMILRPTHGPESPCYIILWAMAGEAKGDQINGPRGTGVQEGKTQGAGST